MTDRPPSPNEAPRAEAAPTPVPTAAPGPAEVSGGRPTVVADFVRNGHGWIAALASIAGVLVTVLIATGVIGRPAGSTPPTTGPGSSAVAGATATPTQSSAASSSASRTPRPATGRAEDVTAPDQLTAIFERVGLPEREAYTFETIEDPESGMTLEVPVEWGDGDFSSWLPRNGDTRLGPLVLRTTDIGSHYEGFDTPGIFFAASTHYADVPDGETLLDEEGAPLHGFCPSLGSAAYEDATFVDGWYELFAGCDDQEVLVFQMAAKSRDGTYVTYLHARLTSTADIEAVVRALETFALDDPTGRSDPEA